eukprot:4254932-Amphidinium_carterae.1
MPSPTISASADREEEHLQRKALEQLGCKVEAGDPLHLELTNCIQGLGLSHCSRVAITAWANAQLSRPAIAEKEWCNECAEVLTTHLLSAEDKER